MLDALVDTTNEQNLALFNSVMESVACGVMITYSDFRVRRLNRSAQQITGWNEEEAIGRHCREVLNTLAGNDCPLEELAAEGRDRDERSLSVTNRYGHQLKVRVISHLLRDPEGRVFGGVQTFGDFSTVHDLYLRLEHPNQFLGITSRHHTMHHLFELMPKMAQSVSTVMIRGESGVGKELFAHALHRLSQRHDGPFVAVNCAALPDTLLEAELFGSVRGAYTDAKTDREGRIAVADGGTLFLDEVGDISPAMQVKLLRFLQERTFSPLGSSVEHHADVRVVAATNRDLEIQLEAGTLREDFYYRLNVLSLEIPPLRERLEDVPVLTDDILAKWALENERPRPRVTPLALRALMLYDYPGNVRELENLLERAAVLAEGAQIDLSCLPEKIRLLIQEGDGEGSPGNGGRSLNAVQSAEREAIRATLARHGGNRSRAARELGLSRTTLWRRMKRFGLA